MSFSEQVKSELIAVPRESEALLHAFYYGLFQFGSAFSRDSVYLRTENSQVAELYATVAQSLGGVECPITVSKGGMYTCEVVNPRARVRILNNFGLTGSELKARINRSNIGESEDEEYSCEGSFLAGAFLSCGIVTDPSKNYRLEFLVGYRSLCADLVKILRDIEVPDAIDPKQAVRKSSSVVYIKNSQSIEDALTFMGAGFSSLELMETKVFKDIRNKVNRISNCESANLDKSIDAGIRQVEAITKIIQTLGEEGIPENLRELAHLRLENPQLSLTQLCEELSTPISRSGVNHRLNKLLEIAKEL